MIHKYKMNGKNIVLDVNSGGVYEFDDLAYDLLDFVRLPMSEVCPPEIFKSSYPQDEIIECYNEIYKMYKNNMLFTDEDYTEFTKKIQNSPVKAMCLHIAHDCNLRCDYCFASTGGFGGERKLMNINTGKEAIDFLIENSGNRENLEIDFFGGEPLMCFETVKETVNYARSLEKKHNKNFRFTITTNGLLLDDDKINFINKEMSNVVLSLDGRKEVNDNVRKCIGGQGSYDIIVDKYKKLCEKRGYENYYVRGTFTKYNLDFMEDILHINELGFDQISVEPVVTDDKQNYAISFDDLPQIYDEYEKLANYMADNPNKFNFFHYMIDLNQGPCAIKRLKGCGCGSEYIAVTPDGDIYPCHQFVGIPKWYMGNIHEKTMDKNINEYFINTHIYSKDGCNECWAKFYCSGGCNANGYLYEGDVRKPHKISCEMQKKRIECALYVKAVTV